MKKVLFFLFLFPSTIQAQNFSDFQATALQDISTFPQHERKYIRYVAFQKKPNIIRNVKLTSFSVNWLACTPIPYQSEVIGPKDGPLLARINFKDYTIRHEDTKRWIETWELLAFDPNFNLLITSDTLKLLQDRNELPKIIEEYNPQTGKFLVPCKPWVAKDGNTYKNHWVTTVRVPAPFLDLRVYNRLVQETESEAPVVEWKYFVMRSLASIQEKDLFKDLFGGLYYDFSGVRTAKQAGKKKATDLDVLFEDLGIIDDADGPIKAQDKIDRLFSEQRVAMWRSDVTGKCRAAFIVPTLKSVRTQGLVILTVDFKDGSIDLLKNPFANLLDVKADGQEVIWTKPNGSQGYGIFDGQGNLVFEVPFDIAKDHGIPKPYTDRLQTIGCITCHGPTDGWQPIPNQVLLTKKKGPDIIAQFGAAKPYSDEFLAQVTAKYAGNADLLLVSLRRQLIGSVLQMTGSYDKAGDQTAVYKLVSSDLDKLRHEYWYTPIDAKIALDEMLLDPGETPLQKFRTLMGSPPIEDFRIGRLVAGGSIDRPQWELVKAFAINRAIGANK